MFCSHCGYNLKDSTKEKIIYNDENRTKDSIETFVCPRCGKIIKENLNEEEVKELARAAHSEIHRSRNALNSGMCFLVISIILLSISAMFYLLCYKAPKGYIFVVDCNEFYTFIGLLVVGVVALGYSIYRLVTGTKKYTLYNRVLKDIQNGIFVQ